MTKVLDKAGWQIVVGARVLMDRGHSLTDPETGVKHTPTDECIVIGLSTSERYGYVVHLRDTATHGTRCAPHTAVKVMRGNSQKSLVLRLQDKKFRAAEALVRKS